MKYVSKIKLPLKQNELEQEWYLTHNVKEFKYDENEFKQLLGILSTVDKYSDYKKALNKYHIYARHLKYHLYALNNSKEDNLKILKEYKSDFGIVDYDINNEANILYVVHFIVIKYQNIIRNKIMTILNDDFNYEEFENNKNTYISECSLEFINNYNYLIDNELIKNIVDELARNYEREFLLYFSDLYNNFISKKQRVEELNVYASYVKRHNEKIKKDANR